MTDDEAKSFIFDHIKKRFTKNGPLIGKLPKSERDDALNEVFIDLWNNRFNYDSTRADFTTYAYNRGRGVVKSMLQSSMKITKIRSKILNKNPKNYYQNPSKLDEIDHYNSVVLQLTDEEFNILKLRFIECLDVSEISKKLSINPQKIYSLIREAKSKCI